MCRSGRIVFWRIFSPETRFNGWAVGEIHVVDRRIVPNGRRDHFEQNAHYTNLVNQLGPIAREIAKPDEFGEAEMAARGRASTSTD